MTPANALTLDGTTQPIAEWALDYGIPASLILERIERGWPVAKAITKPMYVPPCLYTQRQREHSLALSKRHTARRARLDGKAKRFAKDQQS